jgi:hypothetical protein
MESVVEICKEVLKRLTKMDYERKGGSSKERLIFPNTFPTEKEGKTFTEEELLKYSRISEQELRFLFVEEFLKVPSNDFFYSVETPTEFKYKLGDNFESIICGKGRSASIDMSIYKKDENEKYNRLLNIEFKNQNTSKFSIGKDILKLIHEKQNGVFIILLKNTNDETLINKGETGVLNKLCKSFEKFKDYWHGDNKIIQLIILSLEQKENKIEPFLIHRKIKSGDNLKDIFSFDESLGNIEHVKKNGWGFEPVEVKNMNKTV